MRSVSVTVCVAVLCVLAGAVPASALAGSISGAVTAAGGGAPLIDIEVCANNEAGESGDCDETSADGSYSLVGLPSGSYTVSFWPPLGSEYAPEFYDGKFRVGESTPVPVTDGGDTAGVDATLDLGGAISGRVVDAGSGAGVPGIEACAIDENEEFFLCGETDDTGNYTIHSLRAGPFEVVFLDFGSDRHEGDYLPQVYDGDSLELVSVTSGVTTTGINAALTLGGSISGTVTDALSGVPVFFNPVCAREAASGDIYECVPTDSRGQYTISPLPAGPYKVWFSPDLRFYQEDNYVEQYFSGASSFAVATAVTVVPPGAVAGIDARLVNRKAPPSPTPVVTQSPPAAPIAKPKPKRTCPKGKRLVKRKGKLKCVKKHRKANRRGHHAKRDRSERVLWELEAVGLR